MTDQSEELQPLSLPPLTDKLAPWLVARYFKKIHQAIAAGDDAAELKLLHRFCADVVHLRRGDHSSQRLRLAQARLDTEVEQSEEEIIEYFWKWVAHPEIHQCILDNTMTPEEKEQEMRRIFGLAPLPEQPQDAPGNQ